MNGLFNYIVTTMKDLFDFTQYDKEAKDDVLIQIRVNGNAVSKSRLDDLNYRFYERKFGTEDMKASELVWNAKSEWIYSDLQREGLIRLSKNWVHITGEGLKASRLGYTRYLFRKRIDRIFNGIKEVSKFLNNISNAHKFIIAAGSALIAAILYIIGLILQ